MVRHPVTTSLTPLAIAISVIVPVYNGGQDFRHCLAALHAAAPQPLEIIVVDDGSTDESAAIARENGACVIKSLTSRGGPAAARNLGATKARGNILFFVDSDVAIAPDSCAILEQVFQDPTLSAVFGSYDVAPAAPTFPAQYKNLMHHYTHQTAKVESHSFWAGCGAIRAELFRECGGFKTTFKRPSIEDIELGNRLARSGHKIHLLKSLQAKHLKAWTLGSMLHSDIFDRALPWTRLLKSEGKIPSDLNLKTSNRISAVLCWLLLPTLVAALLLPTLWFALLVLVLILVVLNAELYQFFYRERGLWFMLRAIPLHWLYYMYSSAAFAYVWFVER